MKVLVSYILITLIPLSICRCQNTELKFQTEINGQYIEFTPDNPIDNRAIAMKFLKEVKYPAMARENAIQGTSVITCFINNNGILTNAVLSKGFHKSCDEEALRVVTIRIGQKISEPLLYNQTPVKAKFDIPIKFKLE